jgi:hypothetical protein
MMGIMAEQVTPGPTKTKKRGLCGFDFHFQVLVNIKREAMLIKNERIRKVLLDAICTAGAEMFFCHMPWQEKNERGLHWSDEIPPELKKELKAKAKERIIRETE